ncbi:MAG TPA: RNA polymerase factor sigma-54 [Chloroflexota bacterium]|nr:RNA polymerase factor sigma-54 [Chloroflexota bacterium]
MLEMNQDVQQELQTRVSPRLIAANHILEMSSQELQQEVNRELDDNPALELGDLKVCPTCGQPIEDECPRCTRKTAQADEATTIPDPTEQYLENLAWNSSAVTRDEDFDPLTLVAAQVTLEEKLLRDLGAILDPADMPIAEYLVGSLDSDGYLRCSTYEVCSELDVDPDRVEAIIAVLQSLEPPGIGARDVRECMILQLQYLASQGVEHPLAITLVRDHLEELGKHKFNKIAQQLSVSAEEVEEAWEFIKTQLNPHPAGGSEGVPTRSGPRPTQGYVIPDVIIGIKEDGKFDVEVVESKRFALGINSMYQQLLMQAANTSNALSDQEREHIQHYVSRAKMFIANINQRRQTMQKITDFLVDYQADYLRHGVRQLRPLTRAMLADRTGIHESTVSRATASKYVMLPNGEVIPFSNFFTASLSVKDIIKEMIDNEDRPLTDQEIANRLSEEYGYTVARRTVAKYRDQLDILPSSLR